MNKHRRVAWLAGCILAIGAACGSDDESSSTTAPAETTLCPEGETGSTQSDEAWYRKCEVLANEPGADWLATNGFAVTLLYSFGEDNINNAGNLGLYVLTSDDDAMTATKAFVDYVDNGQYENALVAPNYIVFLSPVWTYGPSDDGVPYTKGSDQEVNRSPDGTAVAVVDTGLADSRPADGRYTNATFVDPAKFFSGDAPKKDAYLRLLRQGASPPELGTGRAAGHGTFIAGLIGQEAPHTKIFATQILFADQDDEAMNITDDARLAIAIDGVLTSSDASILNLSLGTYGAFRKDKPTLLPPPPATYWMLNHWKSQKPALQVAAAAGNIKEGTDSLGPTPPSPFYPAAYTLLDCFSGAWKRSFLAATPSAFYPWCAKPQTSVEMSAKPSDWMFDVGSTPKGTVDYTNTGPWITNTVDGTSVVSWRPDSWTTWSGTSFAAACLTGHLAAGEKVSTTGGGPDLSISGSCPNS